MYYSKDIEDVYCDECHHLECCDIKDVKCLKRYFIVFDIETMTEKRIIVCNEFIRLKINLLKNNNINRSYCSDYEYISTEIIKKYLNISKVKNWRNSADKSVRFNYIICERPRLYGEYDLFDFCHIFINHCNQRIYSSLKNDLFYSFLSSLREYCNHMLKYKKYIKQRNTVISILKKIENSNNTDYYDKEPFFNELFTEILTLKTNKNDTN